MAAPGMNSQPIPAGDMQSLGNLDPKHYELDEDGCVRAIVGEWAREKYLRLQRYIDISRHVRKRFAANEPTYIELFSGPGRVRTRETKEVVHGSPLVAWLESVRGGVPFSGIHIADEHPTLVEAAEFRLKRAGAPVHTEQGAAAETVDRILRKLNPRGLHLAFLDPYNLGDLAFDVIRKLAAIEHMDILLHVSAQDLNRNLQKYILNPPSPLDAFAPGWRDTVDVKRPPKPVRVAVLAHWARLLTQEGMTTAKTHEQIVGGQNQPLYWLAFAARHPKAVEFWGKIRQVNPARQMQLDV